MGHARWAGACQLECMQAGGVGLGALRLMNKALPLSTLMSSESGAAGAGSAAGDNKMYLEAHAALRTLVWLHMAGACTA